MSLKDRGNEQVKKGNHEKAIELYLQYVEVEHEDNPAAYTNLALCYFKLKEYRKCVEACENSLLQNRENAKAYYRLYMAYKEIPGEDYQTFINAHLFLKHYHEENQSSKSEAIKIVREFRQKFTKNSIPKDPVMEEELINDLESLGNEGLNSSLQNGSTDFLTYWSKYFENPDFTLEQKTEAVKDKILNQYQIGLNLAYLFLNMTIDNEGKTYISEQIILAKKEYQERKTISMASENQDLKEQSQEKFEEKNEHAEDSEENLFESEPEKEKQQRKQEINTPAAKEPVKIEQQSSKINITAASSPSTSIPQIPLTTETIQSQFQKFINTHKQSRDIMADLFSIICKILRSDLPQERKKEYFKQIQRRCKDISLLKFSLTERENKQIFELLSGSGLEKEFKFYRPI